MVARCRLALAAERYLRSRLRRLLVMLALAVALIVGTGAAVTARWAVSARYGPRLRRRHGAVRGVLHVDRAPDARGSGCRGPANTMNMLPGSRPSSRTWRVLSPGAGTTSPGCWGSSPWVNLRSLPRTQAWPEAEAVEFADRFTQFSHAVTRGRDETLASLAHVIAAQESRQAALISRNRLRCSSTSPGACIPRDTGTEATQLESWRRAWRTPPCFHDLLGVDHLVTQVRRQVENIAVLGGAVSRRINTPVPLSTILRVTGAEIEQYPRVRPVLSGEERAIPGYAATTSSICSPSWPRTRRNSPTRSAGTSTAQLVPAGLASKWRTGDCTCPRRSSRG